LVSDAAQAIEGEGQQWQAEVAILMGLRELPSL
jgi:hypothetical protein